uniref:Epsin 3b n=1 Tax=Cyprinus carpio TaxID=7962 RepID=A0A8C1V160_CYPCA
GRDQGVNVREKAKQLVALLRDEERLRQERAQALKTKERMTSSVPPAHPSRRSSQPSMNGSPTSFNSSSSSPRASDLEQTRPQTSGEEELQLQLALAMSREVHTVHAFRDTPFISYCPITACRSPCRSAVVMEMSCSSAQHRLQLLVLSLFCLLKEQRSRPGDDAPLQEALEERKERLTVDFLSQSAMIDLVDIFGPVPAAPVSDDPWDASPTCPVNSDPWESVVESSNPVADSPWMPRASFSSPAHPWGTHQSPPDHWDAPPSNSTSNMDGKAWRSPARPGTTAKNQSEIHFDFSFTSLISDADQFGELVMGVQVNGRGSDSPETFDLSRLGPPLDAVTPRQCQTPETFLGPTAASLVNLDTLIPTKPPVKSKNPFLSGLSTPSPTNPFHCEQPRLTLNQMRPHSTSPLPAHALSYSASLPLPVLQQKPQTLPSSFTQPPHGLLDLPSNLPQPLLPLTPSTQQTQLPGQSHNPFL